MTSTHAHVLTPTSVIPPTQTPNYSTRYFLDNNSLGNNCPMRYFLYLLVPTTTQKEISSRLLGALCTGLPLNLPLRFISDDMYMLKSTRQPQPDCVCCIPSFGSPENACCHLVLPCGFPWCGQWSQGHKANTWGSNNVMAPACIDSCFHGGQLHKQLFSHLSNF
jgi:hypothetical protein